MTLCVWQLVFKKLTGRNQEDLQHWMSVESGALKKGKMKIAITSYFFFYLIFQAFIGVVTLLTTHVPCCEYIYYLSVNTPFNCYKYDTRLHVIWTEACARLQLEVQLLKNIFHFSVDLLFIVTTVMVLKGPCLSVPSLSLVSRREAGGAIVRQPESGVVMEKL